MEFYFDGAKLLSESSGCEYRVRPRFQRVLMTLGDDESVPPALFLLGALTEQIALAPDDSEKPSNLFDQNVTEVPAASISQQTVQAIEWLLSEMQESLDTERKRTIGDLITATKLNTPNAAVDPNYLLMIDDAGSTDTAESSGVGSASVSGHSEMINEMMEHLDAARQYQQEQQEEPTCDNCRKITSETRLTVEDEKTSYDLYYCAQCDRLLSTGEYQQWNSIHRT